MSQLQIQEVLEEVDAGVPITLPVIPMIQLRCHESITNAFRNEMEMQCSDAPEGKSKVGYFRTDLAAQFFTSIFMDGNLICAHSGTSDDGEFLLWRDTHWEPISNKWVEDDIDLIFQKPKLTSEIVKMIRRRCWVSRTQLDARRNLIYLRNTVLELKGNSITPCPHNRENYNTTVINMDYNASKTKHPLWDKFLSVTLPTQSARDRLQEIFGYSLLKSTNYGVFFIFFGPGGTGKSTTMDVLQSMLGNTNTELGRTVSPFVTSKSLSALGERFGKAGLERALINISSEDTYLTSASESMLKKLTGDDPIDIEYKNKDTFTVITNPKMFIVTNEMPTFADRSDAIYQRLVPVEFDNKVKMSAACVGLSSKIWKHECQAILNWSLVGLLRLLNNSGSRNERFTLDDIARAIISEHRRESNVVVGWMDENVTFTPTHCVDRNKAYSSFISYCNTCSISQQNPLRKRDSFSAAVKAELRRRDIQVGVDDKVSVAGSRLRVFRGMKLVKDEDLGNIKIKEGAV